MLQIDETPFQLNEVVNNVISTLKLKASEKNIKLLYAIDSDVMITAFGMAIECVHSPAHLCLIKVDHFSVNAFVLC